MRDVRAMAYRDLQKEIANRRREFTEFRADLEGMSGSPGEWLVERIDELETELRRRS